MNNGAKKRDSSPCTISWLVRGKAQAHRQSHTNSLTRQSSPQNDIWYQKGHFRWALYRPSPPSPPSPRLSPLSPPSPPSSLLPILQEQIKGIIINLLLQQYLGTIKRLLHLLWRVQKFKVRDEVCNIILILAELLAHFSH